MDSKLFKQIQFYLGLALALASVAFMYFGILPVSGRIAIAILGIILITTSKVRLL